MEKPRPTTTEASRFRTERLPLPDGFSPNKAGKGAIQAYRLIHVVKTGQLTEEVGRSNIPGKPQELERVSMNFPGDGRRILEISAPEIHDETVLSDTADMLRAMWRL